LTSCYYYLLLLFYAYNYYINEAFGVRVVTCLFSNIHNNLKTTADISFLFGSYVLEKDIG